MRLLHTSPVHVARFDALRDRIAPGLALTHILREDWLARARAGGVDDRLAAEIASDIRGPTLCTCTTLGPAAEAAGALRIDRPMMRAAAALQRPILLAYTVESTAAVSLALLREEGAAKIVTLDLTAAWPRFEAGDPDGYAAIISERIRGTVARSPGLGAVVLAQASMDVAVPELQDLGLPVLTPADSAFRAARSLFGPPQAGSDRAASR